MRCRVTCETAGVTVVSPHSLRHTLATEALVDGADADADADSLSAFGGWADRKTLLTYVHASAD